LPEHAVIFAEGLAVESYLDTGDRANFDGPGLLLFADFASRVAPAVATVWETRGVAPLVTTGEALAAARRMVCGPGSYLAPTTDGMQRERAAA
jgi:hypothetical protein